ncbi:hypothetical protein [Oligoflexus tunisiensis]|uniref:hypothetical protein n=1 Tax=Oligoflexus tunisiensis TaxID=708132 RepID=UPI001C408A08|nr:hypothetical protein [Oligoflexus tunisiensis]
MIFIFMALAGEASSQIIVINPGDRPTMPPTAPPEADYPIHVQPDPTSSSGGDLEVEFYENFGPPESLQVQFHAGRAQRL